MDFLEKILHDHWGYTSFRPLQKEIIRSVLDNGDTLALLPTGGGKSVCYQIPALARPGLTLVISPLISLMQDQVNRLRTVDVPAAFLHAGLHSRESLAVLNNAINGAYRLLYVSPERLRSYVFREFLPALELNLIAIDEAHCVSQWGHDFRPDYLNISYLRTVFPSTPMLALTATATIQVREDIAKSLDLRSPRVIAGSFRRENISYRVQYTNSKTADTIESIKQGRGSHIVYCRSRRQTELLARTLEQCGIAVNLYHAGMSREKRELSQASWMSDSVKTMAATTAFGMGIDKPDVGLVIHHDAPEHLEAYYQEAGRAGRDGNPAITLCLYNQSDLTRLQKDLLHRFPAEEYLRLVYQAVCEYLQIPTGTEPDKEYPFDLDTFCRSFSLDLIPASYALRILEREGLWTISDSVFNGATVKVLAERHELDELPPEAHALKLVLTSLLRNYPSVLYQRTPVRITALAKQLRTTVAIAEGGLRKLHELNLVEYLPARESSRLYFHSLRVDSAHLLIDMQRLFRLKKIQQEKTRAMTAFLEDQTSCRERTILSYFGETAKEDCGRCDNCLRQANRSTDPAVLSQALVDLLSVEGPLGISQLLNHFPDEPREHLTECLRELIEVNKLRRNEDGRFHVPILPTS